MFIYSSNHSHEMRLICVCPSLVPEIWPLVKSCIYQGIKRGNISSFGPVEANVLSGRALLWVAIVDGRIKASAVTEINQTEWRKVCEIISCGGKGMKDWVGLIEGLEKHARIENCSAMRIVGRRGWQRVLRDYRLRRVILEKELI